MLIIKYIYIWNKYLKQTVSELRAPNSSVVELSGFCRSALPLIHCDALCRTESRGLGRTPGTRPQAALHNSLLQISVNTQLSIVWHVLSLLVFLSVFSLLGWSVAVFSPVCVHVDWLVFECTVEWTKDRLSCYYIFRAFQSQNDVLRLFLQVFINLPASLWI